MAYTDDQLAYQKFKCFNPRCPHFLKISQVRPKFMIVNKFFEKFCQIQKFVKRFLIRNVSTCKRQKISSFRRMRWKSFQIWLSFHKFCCFAEENQKILSVSMKYIAYLRHNTKHNWTFTI